MSRHEKIYRINEMRIFIGDNAKNFVNLKIIEQHEFIEELFDMTDTDLDAVFASYAVVYDKALVGLI